MNYVYFLHDLHMKRILFLITGTIKWFNLSKGFGFIQPDNGEQDTFVHISELERAGIYTLFEGHQIFYDLKERGNGKSFAVNLKAA